VEETIYPLSPLVPDPRKAEHDGTGKTIWFGMVPAGSREVEVSGRARFDDATRYEARCFVRRHRCDCPRTGERNDCGGELVWSAPTAVFQLASHFDPVGTGNHPVNIQMPDIPTLAASVGARLPVRMTFPPDSALNIKAGDDFKPSSPSRNTGFEQICFFSIPLITIVATFVLNLFLPIVVFLFGLWFLLGLKFCIPPSLSFAGGAEAQLDVDLSLKIDAALSVDVRLAGNLGTDLNLMVSGHTLGTVLPDPPGSPAGYKHDYAPLPETPGAKMTDATDGYDNDALKGFRTGLRKDRTAEVNAGDVTTGLVWAPRVERWEVGA
jgi:hypothetical protein